MSEELNPCPWCRGKAQAFSDGYLAWAVCDDCQAEGPTVQTDDPNDAIAAWNLRDTTAVQQEREECAKVVDAYRERYGGNWPALVEVAAAIRGRGE